MTAVWGFALCFAVSAPLTWAFDLTDRSACRDIFRVNFWFILDMKHAPANLDGPWNLVETMFREMTNPRMYFPNLREYTFSVSYGTPGTKLPDFYTISPCKTIDCLRQAIASHKAHKSSTKTSNVYSSLEEIFLRGPVNGQQGRGLQEFVLVGTKMLLILFSTGSKRSDSNVDIWHKMLSFLPIRGLVTIAIDNNPDSKTLIAGHEGMKHFYHFMVDATFTPSNQAAEVPRALKAFRSAPRKGGVEMCTELNYCQYSGQVTPCIRAQNGSCFKRADIKIKPGRLCLTEGYNLCQNFEPCDNAATTKIVIPLPPMTTKTKFEAESTTIVIDNLVGPVSTTSAPMTAAIFGISGFLFIVVMVIVILVFVIMKKKGRSQIKIPPKTDKSAKKALGKGGAGDQRTAAVQASMMDSIRSKSKSTARTGGTPGSATPRSPKTPLVKNTSKSKASSKAASSKAKKGLKA